LTAPQHLHDNPLIRKIESVFTLSDDERQVLENLPMQLAVIKDDQDIVREGDRPSRSCLHLRVLDNSISTLSTCRVGFITHDDLRNICDRYPRITAALWRENLVDAAIFREWMLNIGRREAYNRIAHLFCEMLVRLRAVGLAEDHTCDFPITQSEFADAFGITPVHVNRVLKQMRADGLIELKGTQLRIPDWNRLKEVGQFDPGYLHLEGSQAAA
jgi:hypothetical protein